MTMSSVVQVTSLPIQPLVPLVDEFAARLFGETPVLLTTTRMTLLHDIQAVPKSFIIADGLLI